MAEVYREVIGIIEDYLGPAAERFIHRQVDFHLEKDAQQLTKQEVKPLAEWVGNSLRLLTKDDKIVSECTRRLSELAEG